MREMSIYFNETEPLEPIENDTWLDFEKQLLESMGLFYDVHLYVSLVIYSLGVISNSLIILFIATKRSRKMIVYHFLLLELAIIDLTICCWLTFSTTLFLAMDEWVHDSQFRKAEIFFENVLTMTAIWVLVLLCSVKYRKIVHPFKRQPDKKVCLLVSILLFLSAFGFYIFRNSQVLIKIKFVWFAESAIDIIPLAFFVFSHYKVWMYLKSNKMENPRVRARHSRAVKTMSFLTVQFFVTVVLTRAASMIVYHINNSEQNENFTLTRLSLIFYLFAFTNNILNAVVYAKTMKDFRHFLRNIFTLNLRNRSPRN